MSAPDIAHVGEAGEVVRRQSLQYHGRFAARETAHRLAEYGTVAEILDSMDENRAAELPYETIRSALTNNRTQMLLNGVMLRPILQEHDAPQGLRVIGPQEFAGRRERERAVCSLAQQPQTGEGT